MCACARACLSLLGCVYVLGVSDPGMLPGSASLSSTQRCRTHIRALTYFETHLHTSQGWWLGHSGPGGRKSTAEVWGSGLPPLLQFLVWHQLHSSPCLYLLTASPLRGWLCVL